MKIYFDVSRTPQERAEAREQVETYLQKRFTEKMIIEDEETRYDFEIPASGFVFVVHPEGNRDFTIRVCPSPLSPTSISENRERKNHTQSEKFLWVWYNTLLHCPRLDRDS